MISVLLLYMERDGMSSIHNNKMVVVVVYIYKKQGVFFSHKKRNNKLGSQKNKIKYDYICTLSHLAFWCNLRKRRERGEVGKEKRMDGYDDSINR